MSFVKQRHGVIAYKYPRAWPLSDISAHGPHYFRGEGGDCIDRTITAVVNAETVKCNCWCDQSIVQVPPADIRAGLTNRCHRKACGPPT